MPDHRLAEFSLIERYCQGLGVSHPQTKLTIGDDAAVIEVPTGMELAISVDSMVEGVHFYPKTDPASLAYKLLAVNLSDMAAMGAQAKWATMTLTTPKIDNAWLSAFSDAMNHMAKGFGVQLIGGDTTQGDLNLSMQIMGLLPLGKALKRSGASVGDDVYVSNYLGDAALALTLLRDGVIEDVTNFASELEGSKRDNQRAALLTALHRPRPQTELGLALLDIASSCIDVSDGLVADLGHIALQSEVSIEFDVTRVPLSKHYRSWLDRLGYTLAIGGGDDYQLAFTANPTACEQLESVSKRLNVPLRKIGRVIERTETPVSTMINDKPYVLHDSEGYQHFF